MTEPRPGCRHPNSCHQHGQCMYVGCEHNTSGLQLPTETTTDPVMAALGATTEETPESIQYVLIRGLVAMGYAQPTAEARALMEAALSAAGQQQATAFDDGMTLGRRSALMTLIKNLKIELDRPEGAENAG